jgi:hypothetical protein
MIRVNRELCVHFQGEAVCADWRDIAISLKIANAEGEQMAQACAKACFRQLWNSCAVQ